MESTFIDLSKKSDYKQFIRRVREKIPKGEIGPFLNIYYKREDSLSIYFKLMNYLQGSSFKNGEKYNFADNLIEYFSAKGIDLTNISNGK